MTHPETTTPANPAQVTDAKELADRITDYLTNGGLFNPEMMPHGPACDLLIDCRAALTAAIGAGGQAVAVKPLEWQPVHGASGVWWKADNPLGGLPYEAINEADKARHQTAFERRILSALSQPHPTEERVVGALDDPHLRADLAERQIAELRADNDRLDRELNALQMLETIGIERFQAAETDKARLSEALRPFVEYTPDRCFEGDEKWKLAVCRDTGGGWYGAEDFRRARAALQKEPQP